MTSGEEGVRAAPRVSLAKGGTGLVVGVAFAALALVTAPIAALVSRMVWRPGLMSVPYGLVLSAAASMAVVLLARAVSRGHALASAAAWIVGLGFVVKGSSGGSFVIASDALGWSFLVVGTVATVGSAVWGGARS